MAQTLPQTDFESILPWAWDREILGHEPHERPHFTTLMLVAGRLVYAVSQMAWLFAFYAGYCDIVLRSYPHMDLMPSELHPRLHVALVVGVVLALVIGRPLPSPWTHIRPPIAVSVYVLRLFIGLHVARIACYGLWLASGYCFLWLSSVPNPAAFGVVVGCLFMLLVAMFHGASKQFAPPATPDTLGDPHIVWREDLGAERSNSPLTLGQMPDLIAKVWAMNLAALKRQNRNTDG